MVRIPLIIPSCSAGRAGGESLRKFLFDYVPSYEALEILLLLVRHEARPWTIDEIAEKLHFERHLAERAVEALQQCGLVQLTSDDRTRYVTQRPELEVMVRRLAATYEARRVEIIELLIANALQRVRTATLHLFEETLRLRGRNE